MSTRTAALLVAMVVALGTGSAIAASSTQRTPQSHNVEPLKILCQIPNGTPIPTAPDEVAALCRRSGTHSAR